MICRLCGNSDLKLYFTHGNNDEFKYYKCKNCSLSNYDLSTGLDQTKYGVFYADPFDETLKTNRDQTKTYQFIKNNIRSKGKLFEIGCGNGKVLQLAKQDSWEVHGLELTDLLATSIKQKLNINVDIADFFKYASSNTYDVVVLRHVFEHLPDPVEAIKKLGSFTKKGGFIVLEFPNIEALTFKIKRYLRNAGIHKKRYKVTFKPGHCNEFCKESFTFLAEMTGFKILKWETYSFNPFLDFIYNRINIGDKARTIIVKI